MCNLVAHMVFVGVAMLAVFAQVSVPVGAIPITLQSLAVVVLASLSSAGVASVVLYIALGVVGLPVFAGGASGWPGASGGYLIGMVVAALVVRVAVGRGVMDRAGPRFVVFLLAHLLILLVGSAWLRFSFFGVMLLPGAVLKSALATAMVKSRDAL